ncbi:disulfide bond formation protein B [Verminephrobacter eiseniae]|uniref:disulfide bond formation protein B n=1 Tax=Verminephrobacter eiseniae TaxID=364317 RepID=UPI0022383D48|nr:disulfide bond formation protein B [Verminephrobacter eiseniae]
MNFKKKRSWERVREEMIGARFLLWITLFAIFQLCLALYAQHFAGVEPCRLCVLIRSDILAIAIAGFIGYSGWQRQPIKVAATGIVLLTAGAGFLHAYSLLGEEGFLFPADESGSCKNPMVFPDWFALDVSLPPVFESRAICAEAQRALPGLPMSLMPLLVFLACFILFCCRIHAAFDRVGKARCVHPASRGTPA